MNLRQPIGSKKSFRLQFSNSSITVIAQDTSHAFSNRNKIELQVLMF